MTRTLALKSPQTVWPVFDLLTDRIAGFDTVLALRPGLDMSPGRDGLAQRIAEAVTASEAASRTALGKPAKAAAMTRLLRRAQVNALVTRLERGGYTHAMVWNGLRGRRLLFSATADALGLQVIYGELAPIAGKICFDPVGVNDKNALPRNAEFYRDWLARSGADPTAWRAGGDHLTARARKDGAAMETGFDPRENFILVPLQVPYDTQILRFSGWTGTMKDFIAMIGRMAAHLPDGWHFKVKEHPSSRISLTDAIRPLQSDRLRLANDVDTFAMLRHAKAVLSVNSSVALQAFYADKPVILCGRAFFGFDPLVATASDETSLAALVANPDSIRFDAALREAFMTYLVTEYYFDGDSSLKAPRLAEHELPRFANRFGLSLRQ